LTSKKSETEYLSFSAKHLKSNSISSNLAKSNEHNIERSEAIKETDLNTYSNIKSPFKDFGEKRGMEW